MTLLVRWLHLFTKGWIKTLLYNNNKKRKNRKLSETRNCKFGLKTSHVQLKWVSARDYKEHECAANVAWPTFCVWLRGEVAPASPCTLFCTMPQRGARFLAAQKTKELSPRASSSTPHRMKPWLCVWLKAQPPQPSG